MYLQHKAAVCIKSLSFITKLFLLGQDVLPWPCHPSVLDLCLCQNWGNCLSVQFSTMGEGSHCVLASFSNHSLSSTWVTLPEPTYDPGLPDHMLCMLHSEPFLLHPCFLITEISIKWLLDSNRWRPSGLLPFLNSGQEKSSSRFPKGRVVESY